MFLTDNELTALTNCRHRQRLRRYQAQAEVLRAMGIEHKQRPDGSIVVLRSHVENLLGGSAKTKQQTELEPNWDRV
jgi:hypothetical protein